MHSYICVSLTKFVKVLRIVKMQVFDTIWFEQGRLVLCCLCVFLSVYSFLALLQYVVILNKSSHC